MCQALTEGTLVAEPTEAVTSVVDVKFTMFEVEFITIMNWVRSYMAIFATNDGHGAYGENANQSFTVRSRLSRRRSNRNWKTKCLPDPFRHLISLLTERACASCFGHHLHVAHMHGSDMGVGRNSMTDSNEANPVALSDLFADNDNP